MQASSREAPGTRHRPSHTILKVGIPYEESEQITHNRHFNNPEIATLLTQKRPGPGIGWFPVEGGGCILKGLTPMPPPPGFGIWALGCWGMGSGVRDLGVRGLGSGVWGPGSRVRGPRTHPEAEDWAVGPPRYQHKWHPTPNLPSSLQG